MSGTVVALSGGVGGAKLAHGLSLIVPAEELAIIVNTGDDFEHLGLTICPDLDSVIYALAGLNDAVRGWGRRDETWVFMEALRELGGADWFQIGDRDLALHVERTWRLAAGSTLAEVTHHVCQALGVRQRVLPMSNDWVRTQVRTTDGWLDFQKYFVMYRCEPAAYGFRFDGADRARATPAVLDLLARRDLRAIVVCPSNPFVSIDPVVGVTPIVGGQAIKGPAAKMMRELGLQVHGVSIAARYVDILDGFVLDETDTLLEQSAGPRFFYAPTLMRTVDDRRRLAKVVLEAAAACRTGNQSANSMRPAPVAWPAEPGVG
jgi:LPPG:FO 2-phospho-L-lactate transferase